MLHTKLHEYSHESDALFEQQSNARRSDKVHHIHDQAWKLCFREAEYQLRALYILHMSMSLLHPRPPQHQICVTR